LTEYHFCLHSVPKCTVPNHRTIYELRKHGDFYETTCNYQKTDDALTVVMDKNPDILKALGERKEKQFLVGFAAETQNLIANAKEKICKKNLDMIVANDVTLQGAGFNSDTNIVKFLFPDGEVRELEQMTKAEVAEELLNTVLRLRKS